MGNAFSNSIKNVLLAMVTLLSFGVSAESVTGWDLDKLQEQRVLYEAKAALNKAKSEAENGGNLSSVITGNAFSNSGKLTSTTTADGRPQLVKVNGQKAVINMPDGRSTTITSGQMLPGGRWQVISVGISGVKIRDVATRSEEVLN